MQRCAERRMAGKGQLLLDGEYADFLSFASFNGGITRQNESRFREIHLTRQGLHLGVIQSASIRKDRQWITRERCLREYIKLNEFVSVCWHESDLDCAKSRV